MASTELRTEKITEQFVRGFRLPGDVSFGEVARVNNMIQSHSDDKLGKNGQVKVVRFKGAHFFTTGSEKTKKLLEEDFGIDGIKTVIFPRC